MDHNPSWGTARLCLLLEEVEKTDCVYHVQHPRRPFSLFHRQGPTYSITKQANTSTVADDVWGYGSNLQSQTWFLLDGEDVAIAGMNPTVRCPQFLVHSKGKRAV